VHDCDATEVCDGSALACPADVILADGSSCEGGMCVMGSCQPEPGTGGSGGAPADDAAQSDPESGCSCRTAASPARPASWLWLVVAAVCLRVRRRTQRDGVARSLTCAALAWG
jgi:MYXO-CTERM domain-containing protein